MIDYNLFRTERFNAIKSIEHKDEILKHAYEITEKMKNYIGKKVTIFYQNSGGGFWKLREFKKIKFKERKFNDGISSLECYIYGILAGCQKIYRNLLSYRNFAVFDGWHNDYRLPYYQDGFRTLKTEEMKRFIAEHEKDLIVDNTAELIPSTLSEYGEYVEADILSWQDKTKIGDRV